MPSKEMLGAAIRYKEAIDASMSRAADGQATTSVDIVEMHEAVLGLIWATHTTTLEEALDVLIDVEGPTI
jgi:hypothetical protein